MSSTPIKDYAMLTSEGLTPAEALRGLEKRINDYLQKGYTFYDDRQHFPCDKFMGNGTVPWHCFLQVMVLREEGSRVSEKTYGRLVGSTKEFESDGFGGPVEELRNRLLTKVRSDE